MLQQIVKTKYEELKILTLPEQVDTNPVSFYEAIKCAKQKPALIAEVKQASPSKGILTSSFHPLLLAKKYEEAGAHAISVLTDVSYFKGSRDYLALIKKHVNVPILRKDFIVESIQVEESKRIGADAILLIAAILEPLKLYELYEQAHEKGLACLVECHSQEEIEAVLKIFTPTLIGINNRNLQTFQTSISQTVQLRKFIPKACLVVSESGIQTNKDVEQLQKLQIDAMLIGETLVKSAKVKDTIASLYGESK